MTGESYKPHEDPIERTRAHVERKLPTRFYKDVAVSKSPDGAAVTLDGRPIRTPGSNSLAVTSDRLAEAIAAEWQAQKDVIDPATMPLTTLVNSAIDSVSQETDAVSSEIVRYAGNDLLLYRASSPEGLVDRQRQIWDPIVDWAQVRFDGRFNLAEGIVHVDQDAALLSRIAAALENADPLELAALSVVTTLTGSALLAMALREKHLERDDAWAAAHLDEDWNFERWGTDTEAMARRQARYVEYESAVFVIDAQADEGADP